METRISNLSNDEQIALSQGLDLAARITDEKRPLTIEDVQNLYDYFLSDKPDFPDGIIALGLSFGQLFVELYGYEWIRVDDEYGQETCIAPKYFSINVSPISMIQKRLSNNESIDIRELLHGTKKAVQNLIDRGECDRR